MQVLNENEIIMAYESFHKRVRAVLDKLPNDDRKNILFGDIYTSASLSRDEERNIILSAARDAQTAMNTNDAQEIAMESYMAIHKINGDKRVRLLEALV